MKTNKDLEYIYYDYHNKKYRNKRIYNTYKDLDNVLNEYITKILKKD